MPDQTCLQFTQFSRQRARETEMARKVEKISSKVSIKPSTPTPEHNRSFKLSLLDQLSSPTYIPIILFYSASPTASSTTTLDDHQAHVSDRLKKSLSETLTRFYPLAGRINNSNLVDCNDEGIEYFESRVLNSNISDFMKLDQLHHLLPVPYDLHSNSMHIIVDNDPQLIVQVNLFGCGGIAICVLFSHQLCDTTTFTTFINTWASINRDESIVLSPTFDSALLYPPSEELHSFYSALIYKHFIRKQPQLQPEKKVTRRFLFDGTKIATLRARHSGKKMLPTRVEAVTALLWKTAMATSTSSKPSVAYNAVDMRRRLDPPLPQQSFGNLFISTSASSSISESTTTVGVDLVGPLRESISKINSDYLKVLQGEEGWLKFQDRLMKDATIRCGNEFEVYMFSSWCRAPLYEADFGWGKPNWVTTGGQPSGKNMCVLMDNRTGDGIEVLICLVEEHMAIFERDQELLEFITFLE